MYEVKCIFLHRKPFVYQHYRVYGQTLINSKQGDYQDCGSRPAAGLHAMTTAKKKTFGRGHSGQPDEGGRDPES